MRSFSVKFGKQSFSVRLTYVLILQTMVVFFKQLLLHLIIADKLLFIGNLLLCLILVHHLATKLSLTHRALLYHQIHLLFDLFLDTSLKCL
jgi:hypothetical protein